MGRYALAFLVSAVGLAYADSPPHERVVGGDWQWFTDYAYLTSEWTVNASPGCNLEVGFGMKVGGEPRGSIYKFTTHFHGAAYGIGAVHVRRVGGYPECVVRVELGDVGVIPIYGDPSLLDGVMDDASKAVNSADRANDNDLSEPKTAAPSQN